jgi:D-aspartate ligase
MIDTSTPVLILRSAHHGGLAVTRSLGRLGVPVYIVDDDPRMPAFSSKYCRKGFVWDIDQAREEESVEYLGGIGRRLGRPAVLIPTTDTVALFVAANAGSLRQWFIFPNQSPRLAHSLHSKKEMHRLAARMGVRTPDTFFPESEQEVLSFAEGARFPIILKAIEGRQAKINGSRKAIVHGKRELIQEYRLMEDHPGHPNVMFQEYIPGGEDANWMFNGYFGENSECLFGLTGKKIRQNRPYAGITSLGACMPNAIVAETTKRFMKAIAYQGILDIGYRYDARDRVYKVFDVNPRIGCTFRLFVSDSGMDVARAQYLHMTGQPIGAGHALPGRKWMVEDLDLASAFRYWRDGNLTVHEWLRSLRGVQESAFFAADDPGPLLLRCVNNFRELRRKLRNRVMFPQISSPPSALPGRAARS